MYACVLSHYNKTKPQTEVDSTSNTVIGILRCLHRKCKITYSVSLIGKRFCMFFFSASTY